MATELSVGRLRFGGSGCGLEVPLECSSHRISGVVNIRSITGNDLDGLIDKIRSLFLVELAEICVNLVEGIVEESGLLLQFLLLFSAVERVELGERGVVGGPSRLVELSGVRGAQQLLVFRDEVLEHRKPSLLRL